MNKDGRHVSTSSNCSENEAKMLDTGAAILPFWGQLESESAHGTAGSKPKTIHALDHLWVSLSCLYSVKSLIKTTLTENEHTSVWKMYLTCTLGLSFVHVPSPYMEEVELMTYIAASQQGPLTMTLFCPSLYTVYQLEKTSVWGTCCCWS